MTDLGTSGTAESTVRPAGFTIGSEPPNTSPLDRFLARGEAVRDDELGAELARLEAEIEAELESYLSDDYPE